MGQNTLRNSLEIVGKETVNAICLKLRGMEYKVKLSKACDWCPRWRDNETGNKKTVTAAIISHISRFKASHKHSYRKNHCVKQDRQWCYFSAPAGIVMLSVFVREHQRQEYSSQIWPGLVAEMNQWVVWRHATMRTWAWIPRIHIVIMVTCSCNPRQMRAERGNYLEALGTASLVYSAQSNKKTRIK